MRKPLLIVIAAIALGLAGCAGQAAASQKPVETTHVDLPPSYRFDPTVIRVHVGQTVTWTNRDNFTHDVHVLGGINWQSPALHPGESTSYTFNRAGEFPYVCDFHSQNMKGKVIVVPAGQ